MLSDVLKNFFNCFTIPILVLNYNFKTIFTNNHNSEISNSLDLSNAIEKLKTLNLSSNKISFNINNTSFTCMPFEHYDNSNMYILIGPYIIKDISNNKTDINTITEEWLDNIVKLHSYIIANNICTSKNSKVYSPCVNYAIKYVQKNYATEISIDEICNELNINKCYFCSIFKKETGLTFINYLNNYKIEKSKELLKNSNLSLLDISLSVGYNNQSYFSTVFKKITSQTPFEFREEIFQK